MDINRHIYLVKANNDLFSHCSCGDAMITLPPQMDCPWCGCGWLFCCIECRQPFAFARGVLVNETWEETGRRDLRNGWEQEPSEEDVKEWVGAMQVILEDVKLGREYVCLDGAIIPTNSSSICFEGWHSAHNLDFVPQVAALGDQTILDRLLANRDYWMSTKID